MFLSGSEKEEYVLTCVAKPRSDLKLRSNESP
jgi:ferredoxin